MEILYIGNEVSKVSGIMFKDGRLSKEKQFERYKSK